MGADDKVRNETQRLKGKAEQWFGDKTDDDEMRARGAGDQAAGGVKQAGEHLKDAAKDVARGTR